MKPLIETLSNVAIGKPHPKLTTLWLQYNADKKSWQLTREDGVLVGVQDINLFKNKRRATTKSAQICRELIADGTYQGIELFIRNQDGSFNERRTYPRSLDPKGRG